MLKYVLAGLFIITLTALLQHPVPILEGVDVYSERNNSQIIKEKQKIKEENDLNLPQASIESPNFELTDYQLVEDKSTFVSVTPNTY